MKLTNNLVVRIDSKKIHVHQIVGNQLIAIQFQLTIINSELLFHFVIIADNDIDNLQHTSVQCQQY